jgi:hypothetical protein
MGKYPSFIKAWISQKSFYLFSVLFYMAKHECVNRYKYKCEVKEKLRDIMMYLLLFPAAEIMKYWLLSHIAIWRTVTPTQLLESFCKSSTLWKYRPNIVIFISTYTLKQNSWRIGYYASNVIEARTSEMVIVWWQHSSWKKSRCYIKE